MLRFLTWLMKLDKLQLSEASHKLVSSSLCQQKSDNLQRHVLGCVWYPTTQEVHGIGNIHS